MGLLRRDSTNRIALAVSTEYSSPTVTVTLTDNRTGDAIPGPSWPVTMTEIDGGGSGRGPGDALRLVGTYG